MDPYSFTMVTDTALCFFGISGIRKVKHEYTPRNIFVTCQQNISKMLLSTRSKIYTPLH